MNEETSIQLIDLVCCMSDAMDFIDPMIVSHHRQVAYIALCIGSEMGIPPDELRDLVLAGALHDIGAFSLKERRDTFEFELLDGRGHAETGYALLTLFGPLAAVAEMVRFHHVPWKDRGLPGHEAQEMPRGSSILHLADRVAVLIDRKSEVLGQVPSIIRRIEDNSGGLFMPETVEVFHELAGKEFFWLDLLDPPLRTAFSERLPHGAFDITSDHMLGFAQLFSRIIDFKSPFTASHSSGVAASAAELARASGFSGEDCRIMRIAGHLHDLGKLAVPVEILDKPASLLEHERNVIRHHAFYTHRLLKTIPALDRINTWGAFHHERLDGTGYPFHLTERDLPLGSQIMAVADVFTAVTEDRPYREGMTHDAALRVLDAMARQRALNSGLVSQLAERFHEINEARMQAQADASRQYRQVLPISA